MKFAAFIPARGGSTRLPGKNLATVAGVSLLRRAIDRCTWAGIADVTVSTDDPEIAIEAANTRPRPMIHARPPELATATAKVEDAIAHWVETMEIDADVLVLLNPTSPLLPASRLIEAMKLMHHGYASVYAVERMPPREFMGTLEEHENGDPWVTLGWDLVTRPRTQDCASMVHEAGSMYLVTREHFMATRSLMARPGLSSVVILDAHEAVDINTAADLEFARRIGGGA